MTPINFSYVKPFEINLSKEGEPQTLTILVLDKEANDNYWKRLHCFAKQVSELKLAGPEEATAWVISPKFGNHDAMADLAVEHYPELKGQEEVVKEHITDVLTFLYNIPVEWNDLDEEYLALKLKDGRVEINTYWQ